MAQVFTDVSGTKVTVRVVIDPADINLTGSDRWEVVISAKTDHGLGATGVPDYPYYVDAIRGNGSSTFTRTLRVDGYVAELATTGQGVVDYSMFDITGAATGSLVFVTVPEGASIYFGATLKGITDPDTGVLTIQNIPAGNIGFTAKKTGYNDLTGSVTVVSGQATAVLITLTARTPGKAAEGNGGIILLGLLGAGILGAVIIAKRK